MDKKAFVIMERKGTKEMENKRKKGIRPVDDVPLG